MKQRQFLVGAEAHFRRDKLEDIDTLQTPAVAGGNGLQLVLGLGQGDVKATLALPHAREQELQRQRRLARPGASLDQVDALGVEAAAEDIVQPGAAGRSHIRYGGGRCGGGNYVSRPGNLKPQKRGIW